MNSATLKRSEDGHREQRETGLSCKRLKQRDRVEPTVSVRNSKVKKLIIKVSEQSAPARILAGVHPTGKQSKEEDI